MDHMNILGEYARMQQLLAACGQQQGFNAYNGFGAAGLAQDPLFYSKERKAKDYAAQVRSRNPKMQVRKLT